MTTQNKYATPGNERKELSLTERVNKIYTLRKNAKSCFPKESEEHTFNRIISIYKYYDINPMKLEDYETAKRIIKNE